MAPVEEEAISSTKPHRDAPPPADTVSRNGDPRVESQPERQGAVEAEPRRLPPEQAEPEPLTRGKPREELEEWRDRALRLQADMENYRKRQQRAAQDQIGQERSRLLNGFLDIVDDLERALAVPESGHGLSDEAGLRRGIELTHRAAMQLLEKEGVVAIEAEHQSFDPNLHEAVATVPRDGSGVEPGTVNQVIEPGYRLGEQLLRPAKVVVVV